MKPDPLVRILLAVIAVFLGIIALRPLAATAPVQAQAATAQPAVYPFYVEPGTAMLRSPDGKSQVIGKVMVDMTTGNIWGFPTLGGQPYPMDSTTSQPPVSSPMYLGRYDFAGAIR